MIQRLSSEKDFLVSRLPLHNGREQVGSTKETAMMVSWGLDFGRINLKQKHESTAEKRERMVVQKQYTSSFHVPPFWLLIWLVIHRLKTELKIVNTKILSITNQLF